jgi:hypothetical protein
VIGQPAWDIDAHEFKGRIDRAVGAIDWRGLVKTPSASTTMTSDAAVPARA